MKSLDVQKVEKDQIMKQLFLSALVIMLTVGSLFGQKFDQGNTYGVTFKQMIKAADEAYNIDQDYYTALRYYGMAAKARPNDLSARYKYGESARMVGSYKLARDAYKEVMKAEGKEDFPLTQYWLANMYQLLGDYESAIDGYNEFINTQTGNEDVSTYHLQLAKKGLKDTNWAKDIAEEQHNVTVMHLDESINTPNKEFGAFILNDTLFYASLSYQSNKDDAPTERPYARILFTTDSSSAELLPGNVNDTLLHTANLVYNSDRKVRFFTRCDYLSNRSANIRCAIFTQKLEENGQWSTPEKITDHINKNDYTYTHPSIGLDLDTQEEYLYFVSDQPGGKGKLDIWISKIDENGALMPPENLSFVNTEENEVTPFFHSGTKTLYYSTEGVLGLGGYDIQKVKKTPFGWDEVVNLGKPVNSSLNDLYFTLNEDGSKGYFSSNREGSLYLEKEFELCCDDLYAVEFDIKSELLVSTFDGLDESMLAGTTVKLLKINDDGSTEEIAELTNPNDNMFNFFVDRGEKFILEGSKDGYVQSRDTLQVPLDAPDQITQDLYLSPISVDLKALAYDIDTKLPINNVTVQVIEKDETGERVVQEQVNEYGNDFEFPLELDKQYLIRASKSGFQPLEELQLSTYDLAKPEVFLAELFLKRTSFGDYLPLAIYFDNDYPDQNSTRRTTDISYAETVEEYYDKKEEYKLLFTEPMDEEETFLTAQRYEAFFEREVNRGFNDLQSFSTELLNFLEGGNEVTVRLKGFASPRAAASYNYNLSLRRIVSVQNFFRSYKGGAFMSYINEGKLKLEREAIGEEKAPNCIIDLIEDERNSIYSLGASLERRVEIVEVEVRLNDANAFSQPTFITKGGSRE